MISQNIKFSRLLSFFAVILAGASFPLALLISRIGYQENLLEIVYFQSTVVFFTFVAQLGLRAGGRIHLHLGNLQTINYVTSFIARNCWKLGAVFSFIVVLFDIPFHPSFILLQAFLSYLQGLYVARKNNSMVIFNSFLIASAVFIACSMVVFLNGRLSTQVIEVLSILTLICLSSLKDSRNKIAREFRLFLSLINRYKGLQYSSYIVYISTYIFAQIFVFSGTANQEFIEIYADCALVAGIQLLVIGQMSVFIEGDIIRSRAYRKYIYGYLVWCLVSAGFFLLIYSKLTTVNFPLLIFVTYITILSRLVFSFCSQYVGPWARNYIYKLGVFSVCSNIVVSFLIIFNYGSLGSNLVTLLIFSVSGLVLTVMLLVYEKFRKIDLFI